MTSQIEKMKNNSFPEDTSPLSADDCDDDNRPYKDHNITKGPFRLDTNTFEDKDHTTLNALIKVMFQRMKNSNISFKESSRTWPVKNLADKCTGDDCNDDVKPNLFDNSGEVDSMKGFVRRDTKIIAHGTFDDQDYPMSDAVSPESTSQIHQRKNANQDDAMFDDVSSKPGTPSFRESFVQLDTNDSSMENASHHDPKSFTGIRETNRSIPSSSGTTHSPRPSFRDDRADIMFGLSDDQSVFLPFSGPGYDASASSFVPVFSPPVLFTGSAFPPSDVFADLASQLPRPRIGSPALYKATQARRKYPGWGRFCCDLCGHDFTTKANLQHHVNSHYSKKHKCTDCTHMFATKSSLRRHSKTCRGVQARTLSEPIQPKRENPVQQLLGAVAVSQRIVGHPVSFPLPPSSDSPSLSPYVPAEAFPSLSMALLNSSSAPTSAKEPPTFPPNAHTSSPVVPW